MAAASSMAGKQQWVLEEAPHPQAGPLLVDKKANKVYAAADGQWPRLVGQLESSTGAITVRPSRASEPLIHISQRVSGASRVSLTRMGAHRRIAHVLFVVGEKPPTSWVCSDIRMRPHASQQAAAQEADELTMRERWSG